MLGVRGSGFATRALGSVNVNVRVTEGPRLGRPDVQDSVVVRPAEGLGAGRAGAQRASGLGDRPGGPPAVGRWAGSAGAAGAAGRGSFTGRPVGPVTGSRRVAGSAGCERFEGQRRGLACSPLPRGDRPRSAPAPAPDRATARAARRAGTGHDLPPAGIAPCRGREQDSPTAGSDGSTAYPTPGARPITTQRAAHRAGVLAGSARANFGHPAAPTRRSQRGSARRRGSDHGLSGTPRSGRISPSVAAQSG